MPQSTAKPTLLHLLAATRAVTGLRVIFRDLSGRSALPGEWMHHNGPGCLAAKAAPGGFARCIAFCAGSVLRELAAEGRPRIHTCPFGKVEIAIPVHNNDSYLGVLFAGLPEGTAPPERAWLEDRLAVLEAVAGHIAVLIAGTAVVGDDRQARIVAHLEQHLHDHITLTDLAHRIGLSPSRCGHHVRELFGITFPALVRRIRMQTAARLLAQHGLSVAEAAARVGCRDRDWFARHFREIHGCTPATWLRRHHQA
jgi:AraC-like DNA-binding protein